MLGWYCAFPLVVILLSVSVFADDREVVADDIVAGFPWITESLGNHQSKVEQAYAAGMVVQRLRDFFADDSRSRLWNHGAGRRAYPDEPVDIRRLPPGAGRFGIFVAFEPADVGLYRALLPSSFGMPAAPVVSMVAVDYNQPNPVRRYKEGMVMLKALASNGDETWYVHSMPVEDWLMLAMGHDWGFRKELFDMVVSNDHASVHRRDGGLYFSLELTDEPYDEATAVVADGGAGGINNMAVVYPRDTQMAMIHGVVGAVVRLEKTQAMVRIRVGENIDWAGLVPASGKASGFFQRFVYDRANGFILKL